MEDLDALRHKITQAIGNPGPIFFAKEGLGFARFENGFVAVIFEQGNNFFKLDSDSWASVVASMSDGGETRKNHKIALDYHKGISFEHKCCIDGSATNLMEEDKSDKKIENTKSKKRNLTKK